MTKRIKIIDRILFAGLVILFSYFLGNLILCQTVYADMPHEGYPSDIGPYMQEILGTNTRYPFPYPLFFGLGRLLLRFMPVDHAIMFAEVLLNALALVFSKFYIEKYVFGECGSEEKPYLYFAVTFFTFALFMLSMWWLPRFSKITLPFKSQAYEGTFTGNPWHNATYIATRPFAIVSLFSFLDCYREYEKGLNIKNAIVFSVSLLLTTITKPSFTFVFLSAAGLCMASKVIIKKFKNIKQTLIFSICFVPTFAALIFQYSNVFGGSSIYEDHGLGFCFFDVWKIHSDHILAAIFYANAFSLICLFIFLKDIKSDLSYRFIIFMFVISVLEAGILYEDGPRYGDFNFSWGYMHGIFFFEMISMIKLITATVKKERKLYVIIPAWCIFMIHLVCGILYFKGIYYGRDYATLLPATWL